MLKDLQYFNKVGKCIVYTHSLDFSLNRTDLRSNSLLYLTKSISRFTGNTHQTFESDLDFFFLLKGYLDQCLLSKQIILFVIFYEKGNNPFYASVA